MNKIRFADRYFYAPNFWMKALAILLLPLSILYGICAFLRRTFSRKIDFKIPIISVGNLVSGGSGKTPFIIALAARYDSVCVVSRGYKRESKGLVVVALNSKILTTQKQAGDEPFLIAKSFEKNKNNGMVIVSKNRKEAIEKAIDLGAKIVLLDDGFRFNFKKLNIVLKPKLKPYFPFVIPSGIYREFPFFERAADLVLQDGIDYKRIVKIKNPTPKMLLLTAIANPQRLFEFIPDADKICGVITLKDHANFDLEKIKKEFEKCGANSLLVTTKDAVKLEDSPFLLSVLELDLDIDSKILERIDLYVKECK